MELKMIKGSEPIFIKGNKTGFLLVHGFTSTPWEMKPLADFLAKRGYTVSVPLLSGHGTIPASLKKVSWYNWFEDVKKDLFKLRKKCKTVIVVGLSTGAALAMHLAAHYQLEGVVALSPTLVLKQKKVKYLRFVPSFINIKLNKKGPDISDETERLSALTYKKTPLKAAREVIRLYEHVKMDLKDIYTRLLIVHSRNDHVADMQSAEYIYNEVSSTDKHFLTLENSYHIVTRDIEKEIVFREIGHFVDNLSER